MKWAGEYILTPICTSFTWTGERNSLIFFCGWPEIWVPNIDFFPWKIAMEFPWFWPSTNTRSYSNFLNRTIFSNRNPVKHSENMSAFWYLALRISSYKKRCANWSWKILGQFSSNTHYHNERHWPVNECVCDVKILNKNNILKCNNNKISRENLYIRTIVHRIGKMRLCNVCMRACVCGCAFTSMWRNENALFSIKFLWYTLTLPHTRIHSHTRQLEYDSGVWKP